MYWSIGSTSFRVGNHIVKNKELLSTLSKFWNNHSSWDDSTQSDFYDLAFEDGLVKGTANRKSKDARQITSGLSELGLVSPQRIITEVGKSILNLEKTKDDLFLIDSDNYIYLKQLLKLQSDNVRPFIAFIYLLCKLNYLTYDEFTYFLPICNDSQEVVDIVEKIKLVRNDELKFDDVIINQILKEHKICEAIHSFSEKPNLSLSDFVDLDMNRKSSQYSKPLVDLYNCLLYYYNHKNSIDINYFVSLKETFKGLSSNLKTEYTKYFNLSYFIKEENFERYKNHFDSLDIFNSDSIKAFNLNFAKLVHLCKWKSTLTDYADLNRRYFLTADIIKYGNKKFELDIIPKYIFNKIIDELLAKPVIQDKKAYRSFLESDSDLITIDKSFALEIADIKPYIEKDYNIKISNIDEIKSFIDNKKLEQINSLIDKYFMPNQLIELFTYISKREDSKIKGYADMDSDVSISTIYEYLIAIAWYHVSGRRGNILKFMNLKLDVNMLPVIHAPGYFSDLVFDYIETSEYPQHTVLIEATLSDSTTQRRMEMEPVSRHLVNYKNFSKIESYSLFIANELHTLVLSDFRSRKNYYYQIKEEICKGLKIIPISTDDLCYILKNEITYSYLYKLFETAYQDNQVDDINWYNKCIKSFLSNN